MSVVPGGGEARGFRGLNKTPDTKDTHRLVRGVSHVSIPILAKILFAFASFGLLYGQCGATPAACARRLREPVSNHQLPEYLT